MADAMVEKTQIWLNETYGSDSRFNVIPETQYGKTGWTTIYALRRALQIELGITSTSNNFGPTTTAKFNQRFPNGVIQQSDDDETEDNIYAIIQGACWCKGYGTGTYNITKHFYGGTGSAIKRLKTDAGCADANNSNVRLNVMKALLSMDYFECTPYNNGDEKMQIMQQYLNRNYEDYIGLRPCDGLYGRSTNQALIYAIQAEEGLGTSTANGNFGPSTKRYCPTIPYSNGQNNAQGRTYTEEEIIRFIKLMEIALYANGFGNGTLTGIYNEEIVEEFQREHAFKMIDGICSLGTWLSLLTSCGDVDRIVTACDCATILTTEKAKTLYNNGYRRVGRYLSGKIASGESKALTKEELQIIYDAGLYPFIIFQESANTVSYFTATKAKNDIDSAVEHAVNLGIPSGNTIYFAVDCDPQDAEITSYIIPYFKKISEEMQNTYNGKYVIGVYGTRNVCTRVSDNNYATYSFVSDMSTGFSGNLGFKIPENWAFDQFATITIGEEDGEIEIDKDAMSGRDLGVLNDIFLSDVGQVYYTLLDMYNLAMQYTNNNREESNRLVLQYIRKGRYGDTTIFGSNLSGDVDNLQWGVVAGLVDDEYCELVDNKLLGLNFEFVDSVTNLAHDLPHWAATLNAILYPIVGGIFAGLDETIDILSGWAGDTITFARDIKEAETNGNIDYQQWANNNICTQGVENFNLQDYIDDIDAVNMSYYMKYNNSYSLPEAFYYYYIAKSLNSKCEYETRTAKFIENIGETEIEMLCESIKSEQAPTSWLREFLANPAEEKHVNAAISAFKNKINQEVIAGR